MKHFLWVSILAVASVAKAQVALTDVAALAQALNTKVTVEASITGTAGSVCGLYKEAGSTISLYWKCVSADGKNIQGPVPITAQSTAIFAETISFNEVWIILALNPTSSAAAAGTYFGVPAVGVAWQYISGPGGTVTSGSCTWP